MPDDASATEAVAQATRAFGFRLNALRLQAGHTNLDKLAQAVHLSSGTVKTACRGKKFPKRTTVAAIVKECADTVPGAGSLLDDWDAAHQVIDSASPRYGQRWPPDDAPATSAGDQPSADPPPAPGSVRTPSEAEMHPQKATPKLRRWQRLLAVGLVLLLVIGLSLYLWSTWKGTVQGTVRCTSGAPVVGLWLQNRGESALPSRIRPIAEDGWYSFSVRARIHRSYELHVGCGYRDDVSQEWKVVAYSPPELAGTRITLACDDVAVSRRSPTGPFYGTCTVE